MSKTKWTDERIAKEAALARVGSYNRTPVGWERMIEELLTQIRNDMQAEIDALRQQLAEAQARADTLLQQRNYAMKSASEWGDLALLAQQQAKTQAGQWQPVEDGAFCHDIIDGFSALEVEGGQIVSIRHVSNLDGEAVQLVHDIGDLRFCRRIAWPKEEARRVNELSA